eukprot:1694176-Karenia_brevis.AAC.1
MAASVYSGFGVPPVYLGYASPGAGGWSLVALPPGLVVYRHIPYFLDGEGTRSSFSPFGLTQGADKSKRMGGVPPWKLSR